MNKLITIFLLLFSITMYAQNTVGLIDYDAEQAFDGYNLFFPHTQGTVFLLNNCGEIVNQWEDDNYRPGNTVELTEEGNIYISKGNGVLSNPDIHAGGAGEKVELRDWDNNLLWEFTYNDETKRMHHDIAILPNGNVLAIAWELKNDTEAIQAGRDPNLLVENKLWPDHIIEVQVFGDNSGEIVWEWHAWDHLIQDVDPTKDNYGVVADHPERININYETNQAKADWLHANSVDYNSDLDQIVISIPTFSEVWIIDHSTTTAEAAESEGGQSGKGGDLLYRWGNPQTYDNGVEEDRKLFYQHDAHWVDMGLDNTHPDYGKIAIFNNRIGAEFSSVNMFVPALLPDNLNYEMENGTFLPAAFDWTYLHTPQEEMSSQILSSVQRLPNGNTLIGVGRRGTAFEITPTEEVVWKYTNPITADGIISQGDPAPFFINLFFAMKRYAPDFAGFEGKILDPIGHVEMNPDTEYCDFLLDVETAGYFEDVKIYPNPASNVIRIDLGEKSTDAESIEVFNILGKSIYQANTNNDTFLEISTSNWPNGMYMISINGTHAKKVAVVK
jgi:hypothetical protein